MPDASSDASSFVVLSVRRLQAPEDSWEIDVRVPHDSPLFAGHFPGNPVLPAIAQLELIVQLRRRITGREDRPAAVEHLHCSRPIVPGDRLTVRLGTAMAEVTPFALVRGEERVSRGAIAWA